MLQFMGSQRVGHNLVMEKQKPLVRTLHFELPRAKFQSPDEELRSCKLHDAVKKTKTKKNLKLLNLMLILNLVYIPQI